MELSLEEQFLQAESPDQAVTRKSADVLGKTGAFLSRFKFRKDYRRLGLEVGSILIMVLAGGYLLYSVYSYFTKSKPAEPRAPISREVAVQIPPRPASQTPSAALAGEPGESKNAEAPAPLPREATPVPSSLPEPSKPSSPEAQEAGRIKTLLENVRQSNLKKDIELFVSCYASDFENMEVRRRATLAYWEKFNYLDLAYDVRDLSISVETAKARVEWLIKTSSKGGGQYQENKSVLDVAFKKEDGRWRIKEVKPTR
jgi:ketosteroid isomerase-like protein